MYLKVENAQRGTLEPMKDVADNRERPIATPVGEIPASTSKYVYYVNTVECII